MTAARSSKRCSLDEAVAQVPDGCTLAVGGYWVHNQPAVFAHALIRHGRRRLRLTGGPVGGYVHDLLLNAGVVDRLLTPHVSFDELGAAPGLRRAVESGEVTVEECDEASLVGALKTGLHGLATGPVGSLRRGQIRLDSPLVVASALAGSQVTALVPDVAVIHVAEADEYGNCRHGGPPFADVVLARAARHVIVTADALVANSTIRQDPRLTSVVGLYVDTVVELPGGARPTSCHGVHAEDVPALTTYRDASEQLRRGHRGPWAQWLEEVVLDG